MSGPRRRSSLPVPSTLAEYREFVTRVVIDANFLGRGHFKLSRISSFIAALGRGDVDIVVPEVVVWEWAEHAAATFDGLLEQHRRFPVDESLYPLPDLPDRRSPRELADAIEKLLPRHLVSVWGASDTDWKAAVE